MPRLLPRPQRPSLGSGVLAGLLCLGAAAILRRLQESRDERLGVLQRLGPDGTGDLPTDRLGSFVATWDPPRARDRATRARQAAWVAPITVAGLWLARLGGGAVHWDPGIGAWVATGVGGPSALMLRRAGMAANTIGQVVVCVQDAPSRVLLEHEAVHVRQFERLGVAMYPLYLWFSARHGYRDNPLEVGARRGAARRAAQTDVAAQADRAAQTEVNRTRPARAPAR